MCSIVLNVDLIDEYYKEGYIEEVCRKSNQMESLSECLPSILDELLEMDRGKDVELVWFNAYIHEIDAFIDIDFIITLELYIFTEHWKHVNLIADFIDFSRINSAIFIIIIFRNLHFFIIEYFLVFVS